MSSTRPRPARAVLDRSAWIDAATEVLAEEGLSGVRVETLAKRMRVTKGSFYWHFRDRGELLQALLDAWKESRIRDIRKQTRAEPGAEAERLFHVIEVYSAARSRRGMRIELAIRDWASRDDAAAATVAAVDAIRLECAKALFIACGLPEHEAAGRSMLLYAYVFGQSLMRFEGAPSELAEIKRWIAQRIAR